jgi:hydrogenase-4 component B
VTLLAVGLFVVAAGAVAAFVVPRRAAGLPGAMALAGGGVVGVAGVRAIFQPATHAALWSVAGSPFTLTLDPLAGAFLLIMALGAPLLLAARALSRGARGALLVGYFACLVTVVAGDAVLFLAAWELMGLAAYVVSAATSTGAAARPAYRMAAFLEVGTLALLLGLGLLWSRAGSPELAAMAGAGHGATLVFVLVVVGFGAKLGLVPLHGWYPELYAETPGFVGGLYSGPVWAAAIYGLVRLLSLLQPWPIGWGIGLLVAGVVTALWATLYSLVESDGKRLLAYSTVENGGLALLVTGAAMVFASDHELLLAGLGFVVLLYLAAHHTVSKGLALASFGAVEDACGERRLDRLGGLRRALPLTSGAGLVGFLSLAAVPPFSGFVVEWFVFMLLFQEFRLGPVGARLTMVIVGAVFALLAAMGLVAIVKAYSVAYLGRRRGSDVAALRPVAAGLRAAQALLASLLVTVSVLPLVVIPWFERPVEALVDASLAGRIAPANLQLNPAYSSFSAASSTALAIFLPVVALVVAVMAALAAAAVRRSGRRRVPAWVAASGDEAPGIQYTATAYTNPMRVFFTAFYRPVVEMRRDQVETRVRHWFFDDVYPALTRVLDAVAGFIGRLQAGRVTIYTTYILAVFVVALLLARVVG